jgi:hypothetical protein
MANIVIKKNFIDGDKLFAQQLNNNFETIEKGINDGNKIVWQDGTEVKFKRYVTDDIDSLPILDGSIIYDTEKGRHYIDYQGKRVQVGSAGKEVLVQEEQPTEEDNKIWIDSDTVNTMGTEITNEHSESEIMGYSANYLNGKTIVESGSSDNGTYVKFGDGTLIQRIRVDKTKYVTTNDLYKEVQGIKIYRSESPATQFPIPFKDTTYFVAITPKFLYNANSISSRMYIPLCTDKETSLLSSQIVSLESFKSDSDIYKNLEYVDIYVEGKWKEVE